MILTDERFERYLEAGEQLLVKFGYEGFSIEAVAKALGVDPTAIQAAFGDRNNFIALIVRRASRGVAEAIARPDPGLEPAPAARLHHIALTYLRAVFSRPALRIYRIAANAANDQPHISVQFRASAKEALQRFASVLEHEIGITLPDGYSYEEAAGQFFALCRGGLHHLTLFDVDFQPSDIAIETAARQGADSFLRVFPIRARDGVSPPLRSAG